MVRHMSLTRFSYEELKKIAADVDRHTKKYNLPSKPKKKKNKEEKK